MKTAVLVTLFGTALSFNPSNRTFNLVLPFNVVSDFAGASYCDSIYDSQTYVCDKLCWSKTELILAARNKRSAHVVISKNDQLQSIFVSFRGTQSFQDILTDLQAWQSVISPTFLPSQLRGTIKLHAGFESLYTSIRNDTLTALIKAVVANPSHRVVFTGHSLGGALANIGALDFVNSFGFGDRVSVITYGQPRVGNFDWASYIGTQSYASRIYRLVRKGDPVPFLGPPALGFVHAQQQYQLADDGSIFACTNDNANTGETVECLRDTDFWFSNPMRHSDYYGMRTVC